MRFLAELRRPTSPVYHSPTILTIIGENRWFKHRQNHGFFEPDLPNGVDIVDKDVPSIAMKSMAASLCI
jgi:hypothetical protein